MRWTPGPLIRTTASAPRPRTVATAAIVSSAPGSGVGPVTARSPCYGFSFFGRSFSAGGAVTAVLLLARSFAISHCWGSAAKFCTA